MKLFKKHIAIISDPLYKPGEAAGILALMALAGVLAGGAFVAFLYSRPLDAIDITVHRASRCNPAFTIKMWKQGQVWTDDSPCDSAVCRNLQHIDSITIKMTP